MNHVTASVSQQWEDGEPYLITDYTTTCGCHWRVDMWGNVRNVRVCRPCMADVPALNAALNQLDLEVDLN